MSEPIAEYGNMAGFCGHDGTNWEKVLIDATKRLVVAVAATALPTGAATEATLASCLTALQLIDDLRGALDSVGEDALHAIVGESVLPDGAATAANQSSVIAALASLLTELQAKADLDETQPVSATSLPLPSGAATAANQATMITVLQLIDDLRAALTSVATDRLQIDQHQYDGAAWRKSNLLWGYHDRYVGKEEDENASAGANFLLFSAVPSGEVWIVSNIAVRDQDNAPTEVGAMLYVGSTYYALVSDDSPAAGKWSAWTVNVIMKAGDRLRAFLSGVTLNDHIEATAVGYKMDVSM